jgi:hypothetical protein
METRHALGEIGGNPDDSSDDADADDGVGDEKTRESDGGSDEAMDDDDRELGGMEESD